MEAGKLYILPKLPYGYKALAPYVSEEQLTLHHQKHHQAYVTGANAILEKLGKARKENADLDMKALLKELSFHLRRIPSPYPVLGEPGPCRCRGWRNAEGCTRNSNR